MLYDFEQPDGDTSENGELPSLLEKVFLNPKTVNQGEYWAIYEFLQSPDIRDDVELIASSLREFSAWSKDMLERLHKQGLIGEEELYD